ncbi:hypothetical protein [Dyadobacter sp. CY323]|uniref:hypothetical protein n=1 Tax=Dyadobacter sp. CY323 TaxID=2907302 RepID=UPI001F33C7D7|nr:hypothetical protein [Dyadobacter sp. CY323]MCE6992076.1 hypothetical protein [Dyadobacter sp. CY323]
MSSKIKKAKLTAYEKQLINDYEVALYSPIEASAITIERILKEVEASDNVHLKMKVNKVLIRFHQETIDDCARRYKMLPEGSDMSEQDYERLFAAREVVFLKLAENFRLDGSFTEIDKNSDVYMSFVELADELPDVNEVVLCKNICASSGEDGYFGHYKSFHPTYGVRLINEGGSVFLSFACLQSLVFNFEHHKING